MAESRTRLRADARRNREQIVAAARDLFLEQGIDDAPLEEIARRAGVGIATLYRRFPDRHTLVREVAVENMALIDEELDRATTEHSDPWESLAQLVTRLVDLRVGAFMPLLAVGLEHDLRDTGGDLKLRRDQLFDRLDQLLGDARRAGVLRQGITPVDIVVGAVKLSRPLPVIGAELNEVLTGRQLELFLGSLHATGLDATEPLRRRTPGLHEVDRLLRDPR